MSRAKQHGNVAEVEDRSKSSKILANRLRGDGARGASLVGARAVCGSLHKCLQTKDPSPDCSSDKSRLPFVV